MYAIVDIAGFQYKVEKDKKYFVNRLSHNEGEQVEFDKVLLVDNDGDVYSVVDVLVRDVGVRGIFSDWPATVTYYANCPAVVSQ